jgi:hypothetical protein
VGTAISLAKSDHTHEVVGGLFSSTALSFGAVAVGQALVRAGSTLLGQALRYQTVSDNGSDAAQRSKLNFIAGTNVTLLVADNLGTDSTDVTVSAATISPGGAPVDVTKATASAGVSLAYARQDHKHDIATAAASGLSGLSTNTEGSSTSLARADHTHSISALLTATAPSQVSVTTAAAGTGTSAAREDHVHSVATAAPTGLTVGGSNSAGASVSLARADHVHALPAFGSTAGTFAQGNDSRLSDDRTASGLRTATTVVSVSAATAPSAGQVLQASSSTTAGWVSLAIPTAGGAPVNVTKAAADAGVALTFSRSDHKHDITTAAAISLSGASSNTEGTSSSLARADHTHSIVGLLTANAPTQVTVTTASAGVATSAAREDHVHSVATATPTGLSVGGANAAGTASSLSRSDHVHALPAFGTTAGTFAQGNDSRLSDDRTASGLRTATTIVSISAATAPTAGQVLQATSATAAQWANVGGGGGSPAGADTQVQYNNSGSFGATDGFTWTDSTNSLKLGRGVGDTSGALDVSQYFQLTASSTSTDITGVNTLNLTINGYPYQWPSAPGNIGDALIYTSGGVLDWAPNTTPPGGSSTQVQFNSSGSFAGDSSFTWDSVNNRLTVDSGSIRITSSLIEIGELTTPATPAATRVSLYQESKANRPKLARIDEYGLKEFVQDSLERSSFALWKPPGNSTTVPGVFGMPAVSATGTATARNVATTNFYTRLKRLGYVSAAVAGSLAGARNAVAQNTIGAEGSPPVGGFYVSIVFGCSDAATVAGARQFVGVSSSTGAPTDVEPSTLTNSVGVGHGAADTNLKLFYGGSAAQTPIDLGANFPANTLSVDAYELTIWCPPTRQQVNWRVVRLNTGNVASGTLAGTVGTAFPATTTLLTFLRAWRSNNATALAVGLDLMSVYFAGNN